MCRGRKKHYTRRRFNIYMYIYYAKWCLFIANLKRKVCWIIRKNQQLNQPKYANSFHRFILYISVFLTFHSILFLFDCFSFAFFRSNHTFAPGAQNTHKCKMLRSDCKPHSKYLHANDNCSSSFYHSLLVSRYAWAIRMCTSQCSGQIGSAFQSIFLLVFSHFFYLYICACVSLFVFLYFTICHHNCLLSNERKCE